MCSMKKAFAIIAALLLIVPAAACNPDSVLPSATTTIASASATTTPVPSAATPLPTIAAKTPSLAPDGSLYGDDGQEGDDSEAGSGLQKDIPDINNVGLTQDQYSKIDTLLSCALDLPFFKRTTEIKTADLLFFTVRILKQTPELESSKENVEKIIKSAFAINYHPKEGDAFEDKILYDHGKFVIFDGDFRLDDLHLE